MFDRLLFDQDMNQFLGVAGRDNKIALILLNGSGNLIVEDGNFIRREDSEIDVLSFLSKSKIEKVEDPWDSKSRTKIKIGRFIKKFLSKLSFDQYCITDQDVEKFVNLYKSFFTKDLSKLKIVEGDDILKYYLEDNYETVSGSRFGSLWNSCMRQSERNKFMKLYAKNPNVKMLVFFSDNDKVRARALLWEGVKDHKDTTKEYKFMDRIYYVYDHDVNVFKDWARENGYISKWEQNAKSELIFDVDGEITRMQLYVELDSIGLSYFPYLDTFKNFNVRKNRFSNSQSFNFDYVLVQSNGQVERDEPEQEPDWEDDDLEF
jgi:hypothetical protein